MSRYQDKELKCADCGDNFTLSAGERAFYEEKGYQEPKRCKDCRRAKKQEREGNGHERDGNR